VTEPTVMTWEGVFARLQNAPPCRRVYGIPRGGAIVAGLLAAMRPGVQITNVVDADLIVDDIIDSGATMRRHVEPWDQHSGRQGWALVDKWGADFGSGWWVFPWELDQDKEIEDTVLRQLQFIGEDTQRPGLVDTPRRVVKALRELTEGYSVDVAQLLRTFDEPHDEMVVVNGIPFWSLCEHHMLPFHGTATVGYIPNGKVIGLSKIPRLVHAFARRLQLQERLASDIATAIENHVHPVGVGVVVKAHHTCMEMRGIQSAGEMVASCLLGAIKDKPEARAEFLSFG
jgi:GTP cyclohydrolase I